MEERKLDLEPELWRIFGILREHPEGISEYDLLALLRGDGPVRGLDGLELFRVHFLLFHHLHRLRRSLERQSIGTLEVHCLRIRLGAPASARHNADNLPLGPDPLADYYIDLENLRRTSKEDVEELLRSFWRRYRVYGREEEALALLGLGVKATPAEVRRRYRELALRHHPDRGGDPEHFSRLREAMEVLRALGFGARV
jgi:DnaJ-domain-containing protein 1